MWLRAISATDASWSSFWRLRHGCCKILRPNRPSGVAHVVRCRGALQCRAQPLAHEGAQEGLQPGIANGLLGRCHIIYFKVGERFNVVPSHMPMKAHRKRCSKGHQIDFLGRCHIIYFKVCHSDIFQSSYFLLSCSMAQPPLESFDRPLMRVSLSNSISVTHIFFRDRVMSCKSIASWAH